MRLALAISALLLLAVPAGATTYSVTNDATLTTAMASAVAGDLVNIAAASYTVKPCPANSGTAGNPIRIVGSQASPGSMSFSVGLDWASGTRSYISWTGLKFSGDVTFTRADHCSLTYCKVDSGGLIVLGFSSDETARGMSENNYFGDCTFRQKIVVSWNVVLFKCAESNTVERCRFFGTITNAANDGRGRYLYRSSRNTFKDTGTFIECWGAENGEQFVQGIRDTSSYNTFLRDSMWIGLTSKRSRRMLLSQAGAFPGKNLGNAWISCDYRSWQETATDICFEFQDHTEGVVQNTLFAARMGSAFQMCSPTTNGVQIRHCTFYSGGQQALNSADTVLPTSTTHLKGCAFITGGTGGCASNTTQTFFLQTLGAFGQSDSNYFATADTTNTFRKSGGGAVCYTPAAWRTASANDPQSKSYVLASGAVADTAWATLNLRPASSSSTLKSASAPSGYYGAYDFTDPAPPAPATIWIWGGNDDD